MRQLLGCDNSRKPGISHTNHDAATNLTASIEPKIRGRSNLAYVCICFSKSEKKSIHAELHGGIRSRSHQRHLPRRLQVVCLRTQNYTTEWVNCVLHVVLCLNSFAKNSWGRQIRLHPNMMRKEPSVNAVCRCSQPTRRIFVPPCPPPHHTHLTDRHKPGIWEAQHKPQFQQLLLEFNLYDHNLACVFCLNLSSTVQRNYPKLRRQAST